MNNKITLLEHQVIFEEHMISSRKILRESCSGLNKEQLIIVEGIYHESTPLIEASLTADQIQSLFGEIEKNATAAGSNRTALGKAVDIPGKVNDLINKVGKYLQDTTPVKMADQKFEQLKAKVGAKFPELDKQLTSMGTWMKENPGKSAAIIGILTTLASLAGGPVGGAIAGQFLRGAAELIKGEKLSTAVGKGIKTAALGYLSGKAFEVLGKFVGGMRADALPIPGAEESGLARVSYGATRTLTAPGISSSEMVQGFNVDVFPADQEAITQAMQAIRDGQAGGFDTLQTIAREIRSADYKSAIKDILGGARQAQLDNDGLLNWIKGMSTAGQALSQGAVAASTGSEKKESYYSGTRALSEGQVYMVINRVCAHQQLDEGVWDSVKGAAGKAVDWAKTKGKNLTTTITADKLNSAWQKAGTPTDSEELKQFLTAQGVETGVVDSVYKTLKISSGAAEEPAAQSMYAQIKKDVQTLDKKGRQRIMAYLQKQLGTA